MDPLQLTQELEVLLTDTRFALFTGEVPTTPPDAYVILWPDAGISWSDRLGGGSNRLTWGARAVCAGRSVHQALNTTVIVRSLAVGARLDPTNKSASQLREIDEGARPIKDESDDHADIRWSNTLHLRMATTRS